MTHESAVEEIARVNLGRKPKRLRIKYGRMVADVFAFFRGTDHLFARAWNGGLRPADPGPSALICGDLHLENFGAYAAEDGSYLYDVNDFDEAAVAPVGFDLTRCVTSILLASDVWRLPPVRAERVALRFLDRYRAALAEMAEPGSTRELGRKADAGPLRRLVGRSAANSRAELLDRQTRPGKHGGRRIRRKGDLHPPISPRRFEEVAEAVEAHGAALGRPEGYKVLDVSGRVAGIGSLGVRRYLVLAEGEGPPDGYLLLDVKEAVPSALGIGDNSASLPDSWSADAVRVVEAQRALQARPPEGLAAVEIGGVGYRMRTMVPIENRSSLDQFHEDTGKLCGAVTVAGRLAGWSHARGARFVSEARAAELLAWSRGPGPDSILAAAVRHATQSRRDYQAFRHALSRRGTALVKRAAAEAVGTG